MKKINQKGALDLMLVTAIVVVLGVGGFVLWRIASVNDASSNNNEKNVTEENVETEEAQTTEQQTEDVESQEETKQEAAEENTPEVSGAPAYATFTSENVGFSFSYPKSLGAPSERLNDHTLDGDGEVEVSDGLSNFISFSNSDISIKSLSSDWFISKGPLPTSYFFAGGYDDALVKEIDSAGGSTAAEEEIGSRTFVYVTAKELYGGPVVTELFLATNISKNGFSGITISTYKESDLKIIREIAASIKFE